MIIRFDHSYEGLLSAAAYCYRHRLEPDDLLSCLDPPALFPSVHVSEEEGVTALFRNHLRSLMPASSAEAVLEDCRHAWYAECTGMPFKIMQYIKKAIQIRSDPADRLYEPCIAAVVAASQKVRRQGHHYLGLLRFRQIDEAVFLADFEPDYTMLPVIMPHFCDRMADQAFVIRDLRRGQAGIHLPDGRWDLFDLSQNSPSGLIKWRLSDRPGCGVTRHPDEAASLKTLSYEDLWRRYLDRLAIPERINPKLQQQHMPRKYWKHLTENPGASAGPDRLDASQQAAKNSSDRLGRGK